MRKKIISALLLGLFTVASTSTFVSCKDYDDDISNLQSQINEQSTLLASYQTKLATAESSITALETAQKTLSSTVDANAIAASKAVEDAKTALQSAIDAAKSTEKSDVAALVKADAELSAAIEKAKSDLTAAINLKADQKDLEAVQTELQSVSSKLNTLSSQLQEVIGNYSSLKAALDAQQKVLESEIAKGDEAALAEAKQAVADLETKLAAADAELKSALETEIQGVQGSVNDLSAQVSELKAAHDNFASKEALDGVSNQVTAILNEQIPAVEAKVSAVNANLEVMSAALAKALRSLVFQPDLYVDGIESFEYPILTDTNLVSFNLDPYARQRQAGTYTPAETYKRNITELSDYKFDRNKSKLAISPLAWPIYYHENPSTTDTKFENIKGFVVREAEVITRSASSVKFNHVEKYSDGTTQLFANNNGILTVGLQVADGSKFINSKGQIINGPSTTGDGQTGKTSYGIDYITALQAYSSLNGTQGKDTVITSDYAMIYPEKVWVEGLVWTKDLTEKFTVNGKQVTLGKVLNQRDEKGSTQKETSTGKHNAETSTLMGCDQLVHVWDTPIEALEENPDSLVQLYYDSKTGITLDQYLGIHLVRESVTKYGTTIKKPMTVKFTENYTDVNSKLTVNKLAMYGLKYEFETVNYKIDGNKTSDSEFCTLDPVHGQIIAQNVDLEHKGIDASKASVDREPLVRVKLIDIKSGEVIKDGYILVHITEKAEENFAIKTIDFNTWTAKFDLCKPWSSAYTEWAQFNYTVLTEGLDKIEKGTFDAQYTPDVDFATKNPFSGSNAVPNGYTYNAYHYTNAPTVASTVATLNKVGTVTYLENADGTTNHSWMISFTEAELEYLTHDGKEPATYTTYVRYIGNTGAGAKYDYLYIKLTVNITRNTVAKFGIGEKGVDYWFDAETGADDGFSVIAFNCSEPYNWGSMYSWARNINTSFKGGALALTGNTGASDKKFFFTPDEKTVEYTDPFTGTTTKYYITPQSTSTDTDYKMLVPVYYSTTLSGMNVKHEWKSEANANEWISKCAIDYDKGVYANATLYATTNHTTFTKIATMNQATGEIVLDHNATTETIVNAIGYVAGHKNLNTELRAQVGVVAEKGCYVLQSDDANFLVSWQRPINPSDLYMQTDYDATDNGDTLYLVDAIQLYDWRGPVEGTMNTPSSQWLWAFYNVKGFTVDIRPSVVTTNLNKLNEDENIFENIDNQTLNTAAGNKVQLYASTNSTLNSGLFTASFDLRNLSGVNYDVNTKSEALYKIFHGSNADKAQFGYLVYHNNGLNVTRFGLKIPVTITYDWGSIKTYLKWGINRTRGNAKRGH